MTGSAWIGILCVLLLGSGVSYTAMRKMSAPLPEYKTPEQNVVATAPMQSREPEKSKKTVAPQVNRDWDALWKDSLFQDDRTEDDAVVTEQSNSPQEMQNVEFELVGLARLGRKDAQTPVAIIVQAVTNQRNRFVRRPGMPMNMGPGMPNMPGRGGPMRMAPGMPQRFQQPEQTNEKTETEPADKSLYRVGDTIGKTNYKVKEIIMEESKVILTQNGKETVLVLDEKNTNNSIRRENVKREELAVREKLKQAENNNAKDAKPTTPQANTPNIRGNMPMGRFIPGQPGGMPQPPNFGGNMPGGMPPPPNFSGNAPGGFQGGGFQGGNRMQFRGNMNNGR